MQLQGSSSFGLQYYPDCVTKESISYLVRNWGVTVYRAAVSLADTGYTADPPYFDQFIDKIVTWTEELGIYMIIDWHLLDPGDPNWYLTSRGAHSGSAIDFWVKMAAKYKSKTHLIYEIANEPNGIPWNVTLAYHNAVIQEIRKIDPDTIIIAGTGHWSQEIEYAYKNPVSFPYNVMYAFHFYANTHGYLIPKFKQYSALIPVFVSEWGLSDSSCNGKLNGDVADEYLAILAGSPDTPAISWVIWSFSDKDETCSALEVGACQVLSWDSLTCSGLYMANYIKAANINGSYGCLHSYTTYPTSVPTSSPTRVPEPVAPTNAEIIGNFLKVYGSIAGGLFFVGCLLYYLQIVYYPRRPQDKARLPVDDVVSRISRSATNWTNRHHSQRYRMPSGSLPLSISSNRSSKRLDRTKLETEDLDEERAEDEAIVREDKDAPESTRFLVTNPLKDSRSSNSSAGTGSIIGSL